MITLHKEEKELYLKSIIYGWFNSSDKGNNVFVIKTSRGFESWDYLTWVKLVKLYVKEVFLFQKYLVLLVNLFSYNLN